LKKMKRASNIPTGRAAVPFDHRSIRIDPG
jgi:hypothetical protein